MRAYDINYQQTHDIDWFFQCNGKFYHVASNGGRIPSVIKSENNFNLQCKIESIESITEDIVSNNQNDVGLDISSFISFAKKGFISIDKYPDDFENQNYHVIAKPAKHFFEFNEELVGRIPEIDIEKYHITIQDIDNIG